MWRDFESWPKQQWAEPEPNSANLRRSFIGGSDARIIMGSDEAALIRLWQEKRGEAEPRDLSGNLIVQLGVVTEKLNRRWYEANTGQLVTDIQKRIRHPAIRWMAATLDGRLQESGAVFEAKFMLPWSFSEEAAAEKYMPQLQHNMWVVATRNAVLSVSPAAGSGSRSKSTPTRSISISSSRLNANSGVALRAERLRLCSGLSHRGRGSRQYALSI